MYPSYLVAHHHLRVVAGLEAPLPMQRDYRVLPVRSMRRRQRDEEARDWSKGEVRMQDRTTEGKLHMLLKETTTICHDWHCNTGMACGDV